MTDKNTWIKKIMFDSACTPTEKHVAHALHFFADSLDGQCWPGQSLLAETTGLARETVSRTVRSLRDKGWISTTQRHRPDGSNSSLTYQLTTPDDVTEDHYPCDGESLLVCDGGSQQEPSSSNLQEEPSPYSSQQPTQEARLFEVESDEVKSEKPRPQSKPTARRKDHGLEGFDEFWAKYPRKVGKSVARKAWRHTTPDERALIARALDAYLGEINSKQTPAHFVKHPSTFLNGAWQDHYEPEPTHMERPFEEWEMGQLFAYWTEVLDETAPTWHNLMDRGYNSGEIDFDDPRSAARYAAMLIRRRLA